MLTSSPDILKPVDELSVPWNSVEVRSGLFRGIVTTNCHCDSPTATAIRQRQLRFANCDSPTTIRQLRFANYKVYESLVGKVAGYMITAGTQ